MSDPGQASPPAPPIKNDRLRDVVAAITDLARPFSMYAGAITVCIGALEIRTTESLMVAAGLAGVYSVMRTVDKFNEAKPR